MEAKDTRMSLRDLHADKYWEEEDPYHSFANIEKIALDQAEISFKAGIKEVVEWIISHKKGYYQKPSGELISVISAQWTEEDWQAKLKGWEIEDA